MDVSASGALPSGSSEVLDAPQDASIASIAPAAGKYSSVGGPFNSAPPVGDGEAPAIANGASSPGPGTQQAAAAQVLLPAEADATPQHDVNVHIHAEGLTRDGMAKLEQLLHDWCKWHAAEYPQGRHRPEEHLMKGTLRLALSRHAPGNGQVKLLVDSIARMPPATAASRAISAARGALGEGPAGQGGWMDGNGSMAGTSAPTPWLARMAAMGPPPAYCHPQTEPSNGPDDAAQHADDATTDAAAAAAAGGEVAGQAAAAAAANSRKRRRSGSEEPGSAATDCSVPFPGINAPIPQGAQAAAWEAELQRGRQLQAAIDARGAGTATPSAAPAANGSRSASATGHPAASQPAKRSSSDMDSRIEAAYAQLVPPGLGSSPLTSHGSGSQASPAAALSPSAAAAAAAATPAEGAGVAPVQHARQPPPPPPRKKQQLQHQQQQPPMPLRGAAEQQLQPPQRPQQLPHQQQPPPRQNKRDPRNRGAHNANSTQPRAAERAAPYVMVAPPPPPKQRSDQTAPYVMAPPPPPKHRTEQPAPYVMIGPSAPPRKAATAEPQQALQQQPPQQQLMQQQPMQQQPMQQQLLQHLLQQQAAQQQMPPGLASQAMPTGLEPLLLLQQAQLQQQQQQLQQQWLQWQTLALQSLTGQQHGSLPNMDQVNALALALQQQNGPQTMPQQLPTLPTLPAGMSQGLGLAKPYQQVGAGSALQPQQVTGPGFQQQGSSGQMQQLAFPQGFQPPPAPPGPWQ